MKPIWVVAIILTRHIPGKGIDTAQTLSWQHGGTEEEARGSVVKSAMEYWPGYAVNLITVGKIE